MRVAAYTLFALTWALATPALTQDLAPNPAGLTLVCGEASCVDESAFRDLASELSAIMFSGPMLPAAAGGGESYELHGFGSLLLLPAEAPHLTSGTTASAGTAESVGLLVRKGLPLGFALRAGVNATPRAGLFHLMGGLDLTLVGSRDTHGLFGLAARVSATTLAGSSSVSGAGIRFEMAASLPLVVASESLLTPSASLGFAWASFSASGLDLTPEIDGGLLCANGDCTDLNNEVDVSGQAVSRLQLTLAADLRFHSLTLGVGGRFDIAAPFGATDAGARVAFFARVGVRR